MSRKRTERLVNLVLCLLSTRRLLTAEQLARIIPGYEHDADDQRAHEAFQRRFERDKAELRELGIPLITDTPSFFDPEPGYRIDPDAYAVPDLHLDTEEAAVLALAAQFWARDSDLATTALGGVRKLRAAGAPVVDALSNGVTRVENAVRSDSALAPLLTAVRERQEVRFHYKKPRDTDPELRRVQPWGIAAARGRWYVAGFDHARQAPRAFRLSRIHGTVKLVGQTGVYAIPEDPALLDAVLHGPQHVTPLHARLRVREGAAHGVRRAANTVTTEPDGAAILTVPYLSLGWIARLVTTYGADVEVIAPQELRDEVVRRLHSVIDPLGGEKHE